MSCYFRHMGAIMQEAGIEVTAANKKQVDRAIHEIMDVEYKNCPAAWKKIKEEVLKDPAKRQAFVENLRTRVSSAGS